MIHGVWPIIRNCLAYSDQRLVEFACLCVIRSVDSYHRSASENLELLVDSNLIRAVNTLLLPAGGSPSIAANTYTLLLRALATSARASPKIALALLEADIVDTLYQILTGVLPPSELGKESGSANGGQGLGGTVNVMATLAHRPKDQVEEALSLLSELMPPLPKGVLYHFCVNAPYHYNHVDGVFDHKAYTEKSLSKMIKTRAKVERAATRQATTSHTSTMPHAPEVVTQEHPSDAVSTEAKPPDGDENVPQPAAKELAPDRTELLRSKPAVVGRFIQLMVPILIDVYAATVITPVRVKTLTALLKAVSFLDGDGLKTTLAVRYSL
jgi:E3 ubiquitin-protein ligase TRIP12